MPRHPLEAVKTSLLPLAREHRSTAHMAAVPSGPLATLPALTSWYGPNARVRAVPSSCRGEWQFERAWALHPE
ncbi:hypothetical protein [Spirillospora sp. NPDC047279]|uniref:hypothetical protein n=1 Tax=Spirillospora sp. NPDC047279 TaxID=3155478 RepID=UPI0033D5A098